MGGGDEGERIGGGRGEGEGGRVVGEWVLMKGWGEVGEVGEGELEGK